jgi:hypothetical protein
VCKRTTQEQSEHYQSRGCTVVFDAEGCLIPIVACGKCGE